MRAPLYSSVAGLALLLTVGQTHARLDAQGLQAPQVRQVVTAHDHTPDSDGLILTVEMLFGGVVLIAGSAYALRRSRR